MADMTEKPAMSAERITKIRSAIGRATPIPDEYRQPIETFEGADCEM
jgi:hypothetical protein